MAARLIFDLVDGYEINQGATYSVVFSYTRGVTPINLTGYSAFLQMRPAKGAGSVLYETQDTWQTEVEYQPGHITIDGPNGQITLEIPDETTELFTFRQAYYELKLTSAQGKATRFVEGKVKVNPATAKEA